MSDVLTSQQADEAALGEMKSRHRRVFSRLSEQAEAQAERAHVRVMTVDDGPDFDRAVVSYDRIARGLRQTCAVEARTAREHRMDGRQEALHTGDLRKAHKASLTRKVRSEVGLQIWNAHDGDAAEIRVEALDDILSDIEIADDQPLNQQIADICEQIEEMVADQDDEEDVDEDEDDAQAVAEVQPRLSAPPATDEPSHPVIPEAAEQLSGTQPDAPEPLSQDEPPDPVPPPPEIDRLKENTYPEGPSSLDILLARLDAPDRGRSESQRNPPPRAGPDHPFVYRDYS